MVVDDIADEKLVLALKCGADKAINSITAKEPFERALSTIVISGVNAAYDSALGMTATHGAVLGIGLPPKDLQISCSLSSLLLPMDSKCDYISVPLWSSKDVILIRKFS